MPTPVDFISRFPTAQREELRAAMKLMRRRVDQNLSVVSAAHNATTTLASLTCPANEVDLGSVLHLQIAGTIANTAGAAVAFTPRLALNGTTIYMDAVSISDVGADNTRAFLIDARITFVTDSSVVLSGFFAVSPDSTAADVGTGSLVTPNNAASPPLVRADQVGMVVPIYHTLSSQIRNCDQIVSATLAIANTSGASASKRFAALWVE